MDVVVPRFGLLSSPVIIIISIPSSSLFCRSLSFLPPFHYFRRFCPFLFSYSLFFLPFSILIPSSFPLLSPSPSFSLSNSGKSTGSLWYTCPWFGRSWLQLSYYFLLPLPARKTLHPPFFLPLFLFTAAVVLVVVLPRWSPSTASRLLANDPPSVHIDTRESNSLPIIL